MGRLLLVSWVCGLCLSKRSSWSPSLHRFFYAADSALNKGVQVSLQGMLDVGYQEECMYTCLLGHRERPDRRKTSLRFNLNCALTSKLRITARPYRKFYLSRTPCLNIVHKRCYSKQQSIYTAPIRNHIQSNEKSIRLRTCKVRRTRNQQRQATMDSVYSPA